MNRGIAYKYLILLPVFLCIFLPLPASADPLANWREVTSPSDHWFNGMAYGNGIFVTVGDFGTILTSPDGVAWTERTSGCTNHLNGVGFGNGTFLALGTLGTILTSTDGITWVDRSLAISDELFSAAYGNGLYVVVGASGAILTSSGGPNWIWFDRSLAIPNWLYSIVYDSSTTFLFVDAGSGGKILTSANGTNWFSRTSGTSQHLLGVTYGDRFVAVGERGTILTSSNGTDWTVRRSYNIDPYPNEYLNGVAYGVMGGTGYYVAVGQDGAVLTSPTNDPDDPYLTHWTQRYSGTYDLESVAFDSTNGAFAAVGEAGIILLDGDSLPTGPVRTWDPHDIFSETLTEAYSKLNDGDSNILMDVMALHFNENLNFDKNVSFTLTGGYDSEYSNPPSSATTVNGTVTISAGTVTVENIVIQ